MKHTSQLSRSRFETRQMVGGPSATRKRSRALPPPDPSTRVELDLDSGMSAPALQRRRGGELIVAAGLGAILVAACSAFAQILDLPALSEASVAGLGAVLVLLGALQRRLSRSSSTEQSEVVENPPEVDLPSLTGQLSGLLAQLRQEHGVAYRTRTWIQEVLPAAGADLEDPTLARDLLASAALDAGAIRADVAVVAESHSRDEIVATSCALIDAVQSVLTACERSTDRQPPRRSDPSCWPASTC